MTTRPSSWATPGWRPGGDVGERVALLVAGTSGPLRRNLDDVEAAPPLLRRRCTVEVDPRAPVHEVADAVEAVARRTT